jgi:hypothetical protein
VNNKDINKFAGIDLDSKKCLKIINKIDATEYQNYTLERDPNYPKNSLFQSDLLDYCNQLYSVFKSICERLEELLKKYKLLNKYSDKLFLLKRKGNVAHHGGFGYSIRHKNDAEILRVVSKTEIGRKNKRKPKTIIICKHIAGRNRPSNPIISGIYHKDYDFIMTMINELRRILIR